MNRLKATCLDLYSLRSPFRPSTCWIVRCVEQKLICIIWLPPCGVCITFDLPISCPLTSCTKHSNRWTLRWQVLWDFSTTTDLSGCTPTPSLQFGERCLVRKISNWTNDVNGLQGNRLGRPRARPIAISRLGKLLFCWSQITLQLRPVASWLSKWGRNIRRNRLLLFPIGPAIGS